MAGGTTYTCASMPRLLEVRSLFLPVVACQTTTSDCLRGRTFKDKDLALVAAAVDVLRTRAMTSLATVCFRSALLPKHAVPVPRLLHALENVLVTRLTGIRTDIRGRI